MTRRAPRSLLTRALPLAALLVALLALLWLLLGRDEPGITAPEARPSEVSAPDAALDAGPSLRAGEGAARKPSSTAGTTDPSPGDAASRSPAQAAPDPPPPTEELQLRVDVVHALEGTDERARWNLYPGRLDASGGIAPVEALPHKRTAQERQEEEGRMVAWRREFIPSGAQRKVARKQPWSSPPVVLEALGRDLTPWEAPASLHADVAADTRVLVVRFPVGPMAPLDVVVNEEGRPLTGSDRRRRQVRFEQVKVGGQPWPLIEVVEHAPALLRVLGIPHRAGEPVSGHVHWLPRDASAKATDGPAGPRPPANLRTTIPDLLPDGTHPWWVEVPTQAPPEDEIPLTDHNESDDDARADDLAQGDPAQRGEVRLRVIGHDGRRLSARELEGQTLDAEGRVVRRDVPSGEYDLRLRLPGRLPMEKRLQVRAGGVVEADLHEPHGAELEVFVVDELGQARPCARLALVGRRWFDSDGPTQRIDLLTDHLGRRRIARVEPGRLTVLARWGSRQGSVEVDLVEDHLTRVTIVAR